MTSRKTLMVEPLDVLVIAPHPDDAEIGVGGSIVKMQQAGWRVGILDLTDGEPTPHGNPTIRAAETAAATSILNVTWRENAGFTNRELLTTLAARARLANVFRRWRPRWLFAPYAIDAHPDHVAASQLVDDARFWSKLTKSELTDAPYYPARVWQYYSLHLRAVITPHLVVDISDTFDAKLSALRCYQSQFITGREHEHPSVLDRIVSHAMYWGHQIGVAYGEPFACQEAIGLGNWQGLV